MTRTQISHRKRQTHSFACPSCGVGITYELELDQESAGFRYLPNPLNARWAKYSERFDHQVSFDCDFLLPRDAVVDGFQTPFIAASECVADLETFFEHVGVRRAWLERLWPLIVRLEIHYRNGNSDLFRRDLERIDERLAATNDEERLERLRELEEAGLSWLTYPSRNREDRISQRLILAQSISRDLFAQLSHDLAESGRLRKLWRQIHALHERYVINFDALSPALQGRLYWKPATYQSGAPTICHKQFETVKMIYIDAFETLATISTVVMGIEAIIARRSLVIPAKKRDLSLGEFDALATSNKRPHLEKTPLGDLLAPLLETRLRNGVGHFSAAYDAAEDEVLWTCQDGDSVSESRIPYTQFCESAVEMVSAVTQFEKYVYAMVAASGSSPSCIA